MTIVWDIAIIVITYFRPFMMGPIEEKYLVLFSVCSYLIVAIAVFALLNIVILRYERQKEELCEMNVKLDYLATHDPLTKLYNRGYLMNEIEKRIQTNNVNFIAVIMDVDNFKQINDTYGHSFGDLVLSVFADLLNEEADGKGFAARFGREEFMIIFDHDDQNAAMEALHHLAVQLESHFQRENQISVTFSGGLEVYNSRKKVDELISSADKKLYQENIMVKTRLLFKY